MQVERQLKHPGANHLSSEVDHCSKRSSYAYMYVHSHTYASKGCPDKCLSKAWIFQKTIPIAPCRILMFMLAGVTMIFHAAAATFLYTLACFANSMIPFLADIRKRTDSTSQSTFDRRIRLHLRMRRKRRWATLLSLFISRWKALSARADADTK